MYAFIEGEIIEKSETSVVVRPDGIGIGYIINVPPRTAVESPPVGESVRLYTSFQVREDSQNLYGFETPAERNLFEALLKVSGIGGKTALAILDLPRDCIVEAIAAGDSDVLRRVQGVGAKTAARIVLELKDRFAEELMEEWADTPVVSSGLRDTLNYGDGKSGREFSQAVEALIELGFQRSDARSKIRQARSAVGDDAPAEELIRYVLKHTV